ncbi:MAG: type 1 glutamine amidotransferase [Gammaproteobacteria bacterium]
MKPLYIFRHIDCEGPGYLAEVLEGHDIPWHLIAIDAGDSVPESIEHCSGLVFMGGSMSVNDTLPWIEAELALIRQAQAIDLPVLGHCLGGQLICKALGGQVTRNPVKEIGWHPVRRRTNATAQRWLQGAPDEAILFHWHGETFSLPAGAECILESGHCSHQAFVIGNTLALQCHVEMLAPMVGEWAQRYRHELDAPAPTVQSAAQMTDDLDARIRGAQQVADVLYERWLQPLLYG